MSASDGGSGAGSGAPAAAAAAADVADEEHELLWQQMDPYEQLMDDAVAPSEVLAYMATSWLPTGAHLPLLRGWRAGKLRPLTEKIADHTADGKRLVVFAVGKGYDERFRQQLVEAMEQWARAHPEALRADAAADGRSVASRDDEEGGSQQPMPEERKDALGARRESLPRGAKEAGVPLLSEDALAAAPLARAHERARQRLSPARVDAAAVAAPSAVAASAPALALDPAVLAAAVAAVLRSLPPVPGGPAFGPPGAPAVASTPPRARAAQAQAQRSGPSGLSSPADVRLLDAGAGDSEPSDGDGDDDGDDDSDWSPGLGAGSAPSSLRRGGRLRDEDVEHQLARAGVERSFASGFLRNARFAAGGRSMYQLYKEVTAVFPHESSKRECLALSRILDALLRGDVNAALEHTCRRLGGVHTAAETGNWAMCERLETEAEQRSFVPERFMRSALKSVVQMQAVKKSAPSGSAGSGRGGSRNAATGQGGREKQRSVSKPKDIAKPDSGASTSHKKGGSEKP